MSSAPREDAMNVPEDREYTHSHEWVRMDGESAVVGIVAGDSAMTSAAVRVGLPEVRSSVKTGDVVATIYFADQSERFIAP
jgi:glycine cleavage system H protein